MALWSDQYQFLVHKTGSIYESLKWPFLHCYYFSPLQFNNWKKSLYVPSQTTVLKVKGNTTMAIVEMWLTLSSCLFSNIAESLLQVQLISDFFFEKEYHPKTGRQLFEPVIIFWSAVSYTVIAKCLPSWALWKSY